jgi:hypothetical protein
VAPLRRRSEPGAGVLPPIEAIRLASTGATHESRSKPSCAPSRQRWAARRVRPTQDTDYVAAEQVRARVPPLCESEVLPIFVFDAGYDQVKLQRALEGCPARILVRLHSNRVFYATLEEVEPKPVSRLRRHGKRFDLKDPASLPEPAGEHRCESGALLGKILTTRVLRFISWLRRSRPLMVRMPLR